MTVVHSVNKHSSKTADLLMALDCNLLMPEMLHLISLYKQRNSNRSRIPRV